LDYWLEIYAHEYCHFLQWKDGLLEGYNDVMLWEWINGKDFPQDKVEESVRAAQRIEADNEKRTVQLIIDKNLPIDIESYIRQSNAYILFHDVMLRKRTFEGDYAAPEILDRMNGKKVLSYKKLKTAPQWFHDFFD